MEVGCCEHNDQNVGADGDGDGEKFRAKDAAEIAGVEEEEELEGDEEEDLLRLEADSDAGGDAEGDALRGAEMERGCAAGVEEIRKGQEDNELLALAELAVGDEVAREFGGCDGEEAEAEQQRGCGELCGSQQAYGPRGAGKDHDGDYDLKRE